MLGACVVRTAGCFDTKRQQQLGNNGGSHLSSLGPTSQEEGEYCYLGYPPRATSVRYSLLVDNLPGLLRLVQGAHRIRKAASFNKSTTVGPQGMGSDSGHRLQ